MTVLFPFIERSLKMIRRLPVWKVYERDKGSDFGAESPCIKVFLVPIPVPKLCHTMKQ